MINLKICGEMPCLVYKLKDLKKQHAVSDHKKDFFLQNRDRVVGFYVSFVCFFFVLRWKSEESFLPVEFTPHSAFTTPCQNV